VPADEVPLIVMGASAGGVDALSTVVRGLPRELPAAVLVVLHVPRSGYSAMPEILSRAGVLPAAHAADGEEIRPGRIYVAPPDVHLLVGDGVLRLDAGPMENMSRPSIDRLFTSAAEQRGADVVGVVLSGMLDDGTAGLLAIARHGGVGIVQDPDDAVFPSMPASAVRYGEPRHVVPLADIAPLLEDIVGIDDSTPPGDPATAADDPEEGEAVPYAGPPSGLTCPGCGGALWEDPQGDLLAYRCRVGHGYSVESLGAAQVEELERALWAAITALEERAELADRLAQRFVERGLDRRSARHAFEAEDALRRSKLVRDALFRLTDHGAALGDAVDDEDAR
jgi:two-component system chemotaxis response regulator CheB